MWCSSTYWISHFSRIYCRPCTPSPLVLRAVVIVLTIPQSFLHPLPIDTGLCSDHLSLIRSLPLWPSSWLIADKAPKLTNFWPLSWFQIFPLFWLCCTMFLCLGCKVVSALRRIRCAITKKWKGSGCFWYRGPCRRVRPYQSPASNHVLGCSWICNCSFAGSQWLWVSLTWTSK